jgi:hypothetical protein
MARGKRRSKPVRQSHEHKVRRQFAVAVPATLPLYSRAARTLAWTGVAVSILTPVRALTLGEVAVDSALGQPLSARIPVAVGPGEVIGASCVSAPVAPSAELSSVPRPVLSVPETAIPGTYDLRVTTAQSLYEPMYEMQVQVRCAGTALLVRQYVLMLDLPGAGPAVAPSGAVVSEASLSAPAEPRVAAANAVSARPPHPRGPVKLGAPIAPGTRYQVVAGDALSTIAARMSDRGDRSIWQVADQIFAANPHAFVGGNPDLIALGSEITLPLAAYATAFAPDATSQPEVPEPAASAQVTESQPVTPEAVLNAPADAEVLAEEPAVRVDPPSVAEASETIATAAPPSPAAPEASEATVAQAAPDVPADASPSGVPGWLAALVGLLIGAGASLALLRDRLVQALHGLFVGHAPAVAPVRYNTVTPPQAVPIRKPMPPRESSMVVVEEPPDEVSEAAATAIAPPPAFAEQELDTELSALFTATGATRSGEGRGAVAPPSEGALDLDLTAAGSDVTVDRDIGWLGDDTTLAQTQESKTVALAHDEEDIDLQTLSRKAIDDQQLSQTLQEALNLLESDYEEELTASQVIDRSRFRQALEERDEPEDTTIRTGTDNKRVR